MIGARVVCLTVGGFSSHEEVITMVTYSDMYLFASIIISGISLSYIIFSNKK